MKTRPPDINAAPGLKTWVIFYLILIYALCLRLYGISFEVPHPDDYITVQAAMHFGLPQTELTGHGLYGIYTWPATGMVYVEVILFTVYFIAGWVIGIFPDMESFRNLYLQDPSSFYLVARIMCVVFSIAAVVSLYALGNRLYNQKVALVAALFLSASFLFNVHSQFVRPDIPTTCISLMALLCCISIIDHGQPKHYIYAGILTGYATAIKFTSGILLFTLVITHIVAQGRELLIDRGREQSKKFIPVILIAVGVILLGVRFSVYAFHLLDVNSISVSTDEIFNANVRNFLRFVMNLIVLSGILSLLYGLLLRRFSSIQNITFNLIYDKKLTYGVLAFVLSFVVFDPIFFLDIKKQLLIFITDANFLGSNQQFIGIDSLGFLGNLWWYIKGSLNWGAGTAIEIMALLGMLMLIKRKRKEDVPMLVFALLYLAVISGGRYRWERYAVTLMPIMALYAADFIYTLIDRLPGAGRSGRQKAFLLTALSIIIVIPLTYNVLRYEHLLKRKDTRTIAGEWVENNVPQGSRIGQDAYTGKLSNERFHITEKFSISDEDLDYYIKNNYDYLLVSDTQYRRYMNEPDKYKKNAEFYRRLFNKGTLLKEFKLEDNVWPSSEERFLKYHIHVSPTIRIYKLSKQ